jgi:hypothetical protein
VSGHVTYIAITALVANLLVTVVLTPFFPKTGLQDGYDEMRPSDYVADPARTAAAGTRTPDRSAEPVADNRVVFVPGAGPTTSRIPASAIPQARHRRH